MIQPQRKIQFYKHDKKGYILRMLTFDDVSFWGAEALMSVIFALYVVQNITGGSATHVGLSLTVRQIVIAFCSIPIGRFLDKHKGYVDEVYFLSIAGFLAGISYFFFAFSNSIWQLYILMAIIGLTHSLSMNAWRSLFYETVDKSERGETQGVYQSVMSVAGALLVGLGGIMADKFGYQTIIFIVSGMTIIGGFLPLMIKKMVPTAKKK